MKARLKLGEHEMRLHLLSVWREAQIVALAYAVGAINGWNRPCCVRGLYEDI